MQHSFVSSFLIVEENQKSEPSPLSRKGSDFYYSVRITGLEPARRRHWTLKPARLPIPPYPLKIPLYFSRYHAFCQCRQTGHIRAIPHHSKCRYGERGATDAKPKAQIILDAAKVSAASGGNSEPKQGQRSQSARGFCPRSTMRVPRPDIIEHFGNADAVPQPPERCLSRQAGIVRCCLYRQRKYSGAEKCMGTSHKE